ncbi:MAG: hypothetical protein Q8J97_04035, partial [Flavobacteriaceae bacterium]|nr:hypothetical protein [Flavobacteriaceae bacterium]
AWRRWGSGTTARAERVLDAGVGTERASMGLLRSVPQLGLKLGHGVARSAVDGDEADGDRLPQPFR